MKKIIAAFDGLRFSESTKEYAIHFAKQNNAHLVGVFLNDFLYHSYSIYDVVNKEGGISSSIEKRLAEKDAKKRIAAAKKFEKACNEAGLQYSLHQDHNIAIQDLLRESMYADLLIIDSSETLSHYPEKAPTRFIRDLLAAVQCPVLVIPHKYNPVNKLILLYDGGPSSVHAIKMLSYTAGSLKQNQVKVLSVKSLNPTAQIPDNKLMKEFIKFHFPKAIFTGLKGNPETEIVKYLKRLDNEALVVLGAYQRGVVSRWFRASMADVLMKELRLPLFIAHN